MSRISIANVVSNTFAAGPVLIDAGTLPAELRTSILALMSALLERNAQDDGVPLTHSPHQYMAQGPGNKVPLG